MTAAPTTPVTCERDPACSDTAVRDPLVLTGKPWKKPAKMLAAPMPIISWSPRTRSPRRAANDEAVDIVSASATTAIATAPEEELGQVAPRHGRDGQRREALGQHADGVDAVVLQVEQVDRQRAEHHDDQHGGKLAARAAATAGCRRSDTTPMTAAVGLIELVRHPREERLGLADQAVGVDREAEQLGQLADDDGQGQAVHVPDLGRLGQQVGDEAEMCEPRHRHDDPDEEREDRGQRDRLVRVTAGQRERRDGGRDHRPQRGVGAEHEDP